MKILKIPSNLSKLIKQIDGGEEHLFHRRKIDLTKVIKRDCTEVDFQKDKISNAILKAMKNEKLPVCGTGENIRDWLHVWDHC